MYVDALHVPDELAADPTCRALAQAADLARAIDHHATAHQHFVDRLNEHLAATGITLPRRLGSLWVADDGDGGFAILPADSSYPD